MGKLLRRMWRYMAAALTGRFEEVADPKIQIEQAIAEARDQHKRLRETAASVIANQKKAEMDLDRAMTELEKLNETTQQALLMAADAEARGDTARAAELTSTAEAFANQLIAKEADVEGLRELVLSSTEAADRAKAAVQQNALELQRRLAERQKLLSQLDQAKMAEQMSEAMESVGAAFGEDVPTLNEVRDKIETRLAKAKGMAELQKGSVEGRMREVELAVNANQAQARLSEIRSKLGLESPVEAAPQQTEGTT
ncbi:MAG TPA: PspA/IM30 family protein [Egibacteraceae bacterium]|jgi:phage shock protein A|nr:PspA/IM30 family protein [Egibacteraceae bacterium]